MAETNSTAIPPGVKHNKSRTHGMSGSLEYIAWGVMLDRCRNPNSKDYGNYGGRGIKVCERWLKFENFYADMGPRPSPKHSIERKENDGNYEPGNCKWATRKEQNRNKRTTVFVTFLERTQCLSAWADETGIPLERLRQRLNISGWTVERALTTPLR